VTPSLVALSTPIPISGVNADLIGLGDRRLQVLHLVQVDVGVDQVK